MVYATELFSPSVYFTQKLCFSPKLKSGICCRKFLAYVCFLKRVHVLALVLILRDFFCCLKVHFLLLERPLLKWVPEVHFQF